MRNNTHNLVHQLGRHLDYIWERHKMYLKDAEEIGCENCKKLWQELLGDHERHAKMIRDEIVNHAKEGTLD